MLNNLIFDRTAQDVANKTAKGLYRYTDLNRVQNAVSSIAARYIADGYAVQTFTLPSWSSNEIPRVAKATNYLNAVLALRRKVEMPGSYALPASMHKLDYKGANAIEKFLYDSDLMIDNLESAWWYSDEIISGEVDM